ncbi:hypothetical protein CRENBAI_022048 [Crenichthys baileyi]|uniref:Uncharacterized protein n=1 Tax=Crenichthys baileyi TaxID=28760 RepID=A0AAV9SKD3_9TELE
MNPLILRNWPQKAHQAPRRQQRSMEATWTMKNDNGGSCHLINVKPQQGLRRRLWRCRVPGLMSLEQRGFKWARIDNVTHLSHTMMPPFPKEVLAGGYPFLGDTGDDIELCRRHYSDLTR